MSAHPKIPVILGPTASGKTEVGIALAQALNGEIISVDSRQVYKDLIIGTAMPDGVWKDNAYHVNGIPHHLMNFLSPGHSYTAGDFAKDAEHLIKQIISRGRTPILVGGTGFYFKALQHGLPHLPKGDVTLRGKMDERIQKKGLQSLYNELQTIDPASAKKIAPNDRHKIMRALEVYQLTGQPYSIWKNTPRRPSENEFVAMALQIPKDILEKRIEQRSKRMLERGMIEETRQALNKGYSSKSPALSSFGYKEAVQVVEGTLPETQFLSLLIQGTKAYAKRQRTWFRTQVHPFWFDGLAGSPKEISLRMNAFIQTHHK